MKRKTLVLILRSALVARLHSYSDPSEDHPRRNCWHLSHSTMVQPNRTASCAYPPDCHGMTSLPLLRPPLATSTPPLLPSLCSNSKAYLCNLCNYVAPTLRLTADQYRTHVDLVPMPRAAIYIPFLHLSYLPDPFSLTIMGNYSFLV